MIQQRIVDKKAAVSSAMQKERVDNNESYKLANNDMKLDANNDEQRDKQEVDRDDINETDEVFVTSSSADIESPLTIITMDSNIDRLDGVSTKEIDEQEVLQSSNYGTFSNLTQEQEVHKAVSAGDQPTTSATDQFENEGMQPVHQQQTPVLIDIEEEVLQHSPDQQNNNGRALQQTRRYILLTVLLLLLAAVATTLGILLGRNKNSSSDTAALGASNMNDFFGTINNTFQNIHRYANIRTNLFGYYIRTNIITIYTPIIKRRGCYQYSNRESICI